jgi:murein L,D-transpeptidase YafK
MKNPTLEEALKAKNLKSINNAAIIVDRKNFNLTLYDDTIPVKSYRAVFGSNPAPKKNADDRGTPVGVYAICKIDSNHLYYRFFQINYPNLDDIASAYRAGLIKENEQEKLIDSYHYGFAPDPNSPLGGNLGIHGIGRLNFVFKNLPFVFNWTDGSIAIANEDIDEILPYISRGTVVKIF